MALRDELQAPEGWIWSAYGDTVQVETWPDTPSSKEHDPYADLFERLFSWIEENELVAFKYDRTSYSLEIEGVTDQYEHFSYVLYPYYSYSVMRREGVPQTNLHDAVVNREFACGNCGHLEKTESSAFCHECETLFHCTSCNRQRGAAHYDVTSGLTHCSNCGVTCACGRYHSGYLNTCGVCAPVYRCGQCGSWDNNEPQPVTEDSELCVCRYCLSTYCHHCDMFVDDPDGTTTDDEGLNICDKCKFLGDDGDNEIFDDVSMEATKLSLPTIPGREMIRLSGVEIEGGLGKNRIHPELGVHGAHILARKLYDNQLSQNHQQVGYHHGEGFARVETDSSCDWECVIGPINMARIEEVRKLNNVVKMIKETIKEDYLKLDLRCGTHIHVGAERVSLSQAFNLHLLYTYMEDPLYRLGAANWPIHRTMLHGDAHSATRSPKQETKTQFARTFHENRYYGLSFNNYFERMLGHCRCGAARYGAFEECTCNLQKCTFEFRLFNATANTIKLHAYLALCQALVAKAISMPEIKDASVFEAFPFEMSRYRDMPANKQTEMIGKWDDRLSYIANDLPLTADEKKSIYYCVKNSDLSKVDNAEKLFVPTTTTEVNN